MAVDAWRHRIRAGITTGAVLLVLTACMGSRGIAPGRWAEDAVRSERRMPLSGHSGTVLTAQDLAPFGTLTEALKGRVPGMRILHGAGCPAVSLRRANGPTPMSSPTICVDGVRALDACPLTELSIRDIARVEVYPTRAPRVPRCMPGPSGLIDITLKPL